MYTHLYYSAVICHYLQLLFCVIWDVRLSVRVVYDSWTSCVTSFIGAYTVGGRASGKTLVQNRSLSPVSWAKSSMKYPCRRDVTSRYESYRLWLCSGYACRARKVKWFLSLTFYN